MDSITLESFIDFCDDMMITEEGSLTNKLQLDKNLFDISEIPEDMKNDVESVISRILSNVDKYEEYSKKALGKNNVTNSMKFVPVKKVKVSISDNDSERKIEFKNGEIGKLNVSKGDFIFTIELYVKYRGISSEKTYVDWIFVNDKILTPIHWYTLK